MPTVASAPSPTSTTWFAFSRPCATRAACSAPTCFQSAASCASVIDPASARAGARRAVATPATPCPDRPNRPRRRAAPARRRVPRAATRRPRPRRPRGGSGAASARRPCTPAKRQDFERNCASASSRPSTRTSSAPSASCAVIAVPVEGWCGVEASRRGPGTRAHRGSTRPGPSSDARRGNRRRGGRARPRSSRARRRRARRRARRCRGTAPRTPSPARAVGRAGESGRVRYGDATEITATMIATRTAGKRAESSLMRVTMSKLLVRLASSTTIAPTTRASAQVSRPPRARSRARRQRRAATAASTTRPSGPERAERVDQPERRLERVGQTVDGVEEVQLERGRMVVVGDARARRSRPRSRGGSSHWCGAGTAVRRRARTSGLATPRRGTAWVLRRPAVMRREASQTRRGQRGSTTSGSGCR